MDQQPTNQRTNQPNNPKSPIATKQTASTTSTASTTASTRDQQEINNTPTRRQEKPIKHNKTTPKPEQQHNQVSSVNHRIWERPQNLCGICRGHLFLLDERNQHIPSIFMERWPDFGPSNLFEYWRLILQSAKLVNRSTTAHLKWAMPYLVCCHGVAHTVPWTYLIPV